jgi:DNA-3-methyladenine glycosylase II
MANTRSRTKPRKGSTPRVQPAPPRIIEGEADIRDGVRWLRRACPTMRAVHDLTGHPPLRRLQPGFEGLARIIVGQQLSVASAGAIWGRTLAACRPFEPQVLLALEDRDLAGVGLSRAKIRTLRAVAAACAGSLDLDRLGTATEPEIHAALTEVVGIGPWTADVYIMFCLGRADGWASGDLALQIAAQQALGLRKRPDKDKLDGIAERWRPWRGVAARLLWAYYAARKAQKSAIPV